MRHILQRTGTVHQSPTMLCFFIAPPLGPGPFPGSVEVDKFGAVVKENEREREERERMKKEENERKEEREHVEKEKSLLGLTKSLPRHLLLLFFS